MGNAFGGVDITVPEMKRSLKRVKKENKSPGSDNIANKMLQHLGNLAPKALLDTYIGARKKYKSTTLAQCRRKLL